MDRAAHPIEQMVSGIRPVRPHPLLAEESHADLSVGRSCQPAVKRLQHLAQPARPGVCGVKIGWQTSLMDDGIQRFKRREPLAQKAAIDQRVSVQPDGLEHARTIGHELKIARALAHEDMLPSIRHGEQGHGKVDLGKGE